MGFADFWTYLGSTTGSAALFSRDWGELLSYGPDKEVIWLFPAANFFLGRDDARSLVMVHVCVATAVALIGRKSQTIVNTLIPKLDVENHPLRSIGYVAAASATLVYVSGRIIFF
jgi:hypothetical protein